MADTTRELLRAYSAKDLRAVEALLDREALILGSDVSERAGTPESIRDLLSADFALWQNAEFGEPTFLSERTEKELGSVACDVPFSMLRKNGRRDVVTVRFILVWRRSNGVWRLAQCFSAVPTVGQSAREILNRQNH